MRHNEAANIGLNLTTIEFRISMYSDFCVSTAIFIFLDW